MNTTKSKPKRKTIIFSRTEDKGYASCRKENALYQFDSGLKTHIKNFIDMEKDKLKSLDKKTAKKVVGVAQNNLLTFLKSRAKVYCLRSHQTIHPFHLNQFQNQLPKSDFFDKNKLYQQIKREQRHHKVRTMDYSPLMEVCLRETATSLQNGKSELSQKKEMLKKQGRYMPLSSHHRLKKLFF